jgi:hypothetical protein
LDDDLFPEADKVVLVLDNLNTHTPASLYEAFDSSFAFGATVGDLAFLFSVT